MFYMHICSRTSVKPGFHRSCQWIHWHSCRSASTQRGVKLKSKGGVQEGKPHFPPSRSAVRAFGPLPWVPAHCCTTARRKFKLTPKSAPRSRRHSRRTCIMGKRTIDLKRANKDEQERDSRLTAQSTSLKRSWNDESGIRRKPGKATCKGLDSELKSRLWRSWGIARQSLLEHCHEGCAQDVWHTVRGRDSGMDARWPKVLKKLTDIVIRWHSLVKNHCHGGKQALANAMLL